MLEAIATGLKMITVKEAQFFADSATRQIILVTLVNVLAIHAIITNWKHGKSLEFLLVICVVVTMIMLEVTGVTALSTQLASAGG